MANSADQDQLASEEASWSGSPLFAKRDYPGSAGQALINNSSAYQLVTEWYCSDFRLNVERSYDVQILRLNMVMSQRLDVRKTNILMYVISKETELRLHLVQAAWSKFSLLKKYGLQVSLCIWISTQVPVQICRLAKAFTIAQDKALFYEQKLVVFFLFLHKNFLWVLISKALSCF